MAFGRSRYTGNDDTSAKNHGSRGLVVSQHIPAHILKHLQRVKECYSLGLREATVVFCRALIETGIFQAPRRRGVVKSGEDTTDIAEYSNKSLMQRARRFLTHIVGWGLNDYGETAAPPPPAGRVYTAIAAGARYSLAITAPAHTADAIEALATLVESYNLQHGIAGSLDAKLQNTEAALLLRMPDSVRMQSTNSLHLSTR